MTGAARQNLRRVSMMRIDRVGSEGRRLDEVRKLRRRQWVVIRQEVVADVGEE